MVSGAVKSYDITINLEELIMSIKQFFPTVISHFFLRPTRGCDIHAAMTAKPIAFLLYSNVENWDIGGLQRLSIQAVISPLHCYFQLVQ